MKLTSWLLSDTTSASSSMKSLFTECTSATQHKATCQLEPLLHAVVLLVIGYVVRSNDTAGLRFAGYAIALGVLLFSGSIYVLAFDGPRWFGPVTPVGGTFLIAGWASLVYAAARGR